MALLTNTSAYSINGGPRGRLINLGVVVLSFIWCPFSIDDQPTYVSLCIYSLLDLKGWIDFDDLNCTFRRDFASADCIAYNRRSCEMFGLRKKVQNDFHQEKGSLAPREIESAELDKEKFKDKGPLVMQSSFDGYVKHALQDMPSMSIKRVVYDADQNSIVNIGTEVERMEGRSQTTQVTQLDVADDVQTCVEDLQMQRLSSKFKK